LKLVEDSYASLFPREMDAMFRIRAEIFGERLGWEVAVWGERDDPGELAHLRGRGARAAGPGDRLRISASTRQNT